MNKDDRGETEPAAVVERRKAPPVYDFEALQKKISDWMALKEAGTRFNDAIVNNREFHNPNIATLLLGCAGLKEHASNFAVCPEDANFNYAAVAEAQRQTWEKSQAAAPVPGARKEFVPAKGSGNAKSDYAAALLNARKQR